MRTDQGKYSEEIKGALSTVRHEDYKHSKVVLWNGASNSTNSINGNAKHLAIPGDETTLCSQVNLQYNQNGELKGTKTSPYRGPDRVLGTLCSTCQNKVKNL